MGKKRKRNGKHLFLHGACLLAVFILNAACAHTLNLPKKWQGHKHLERAETLATKGDFEEALKADEEVLRLFPEASPGDRALFHMGVVWAHPDNPGQNYENALACFKRLVRDFPQSALREEARVWENAMNRILYCRVRSKNLEEKVGSLKDRLDALKEIDIGMEKKKMREDLPGKQPGKDE